MLGRLAGFNMTTEIHLFKQGDLGGLAIVSKVML